MPGSAYRWRTSRKNYRCYDDVMRRHEAHIAPGDRYVYVVDFPDDLVPVIRHYRFCNSCAAAYTSLGPDPLTGR
jgi:hypothetical protein